MFSIFLPCLPAAGLILLSACRTTLPDQASSNRDSAPPELASAGLLAAGENAQVSAGRALFSFPGLRDDAPLGDTREKILPRGTEILVTALEGSRARVKLQSGERGLMRQADLEPIPPPEPEFRLFGSPGPHRAEGVEEDPPGPIDPTLILRSNDLPMPESIPD